MVDKQYTLDCDPMVLAKRVKTLEEAVDMYSACLMELLKTTRLLAYECERVTQKSYPVQSARISELIQDYHYIWGKVHRMSTIMGRSYG